MKFFSSGEKIKLRREQLNITQKRLAGSAINRTTLSKLENDKQELDWRLATILSSRFNEIAKEKESDIETTAKWLIQDKIEQCIDKLTYLINYGDFSKEAIKKVKQLENFIDNSDCIIEKKYEIYTFIIKFYYKAYMLEDAKIEVMKAFEIIPLLDSKTRLEKNELYLDLNAVLALVYIKVRKPKEVILLKSYSDMFEIENRFNNNSLKSIYISTFIAYSKLENYLEAVKFRDGSLTKFDLNDAERLTIETTYARCKCEQGNYNEAEELYLKALKFAIDINNKSKEAEIYANLAKIKYKIEDMRKSYNYIKKAIKIDEIINDAEIEGLVYKYKFFIVCKLNLNYKDIIDSFEKAINTKLMINNKDTLLETVNEMYRYCTLNNKTEYLFDILELLRKRFNENILGINPVLYMHMKVCKYFKENKKVRESEEIFNASLNLIKKNEYFLKM